MSFRTCSEVSALCPVEATTYGYYPNMGGNAVLLAAFAICAIPQLVLGIWSKAWTFTIALFIGAGMEAAGYGGRLMMHDNPWDDEAFKLQLVLIILGPSFVAAGVYLSLKHIIIYVGPEYSRLKPRLYTWIFIGGDIFSILIQAVGGAIAASAERDAHMLNIGNNLIITGIAFQVFVMAVCGSLALDFVLRYWRKARGTSADANQKSSSPKMHKRFQAFCGAEILACFAILIRCIYRLPEMAGGWGSELMRNETEFLILDGAMIAIAVITLTVFHPSIWFPPMTGRGSHRTVVTPRTSDEEK